MRRGEREEPDLTKVGCLLNKSDLFFQTLANARLTAESLRHHLLVNMRNETTLRFDLFEDFYKEVMANVSI